MCSPDTIDFFHEPVYLTRRGHGELVLMGMEEYESLLAKLKATEEEDAEIEALWVAEIQERYRAIREGTVTCIRSYASGSGTDQAMKLVAYHPQALVEYNICRLNSLSRHLCGIKQ